MNKKLFLSLPLVLLLTGCVTIKPSSQNNSSTTSNNGTESSTQSDSSSSDSGSSSSSSSSSSSAEQGETATFDFTKTSFSEGTNINNAAKCQELADYMNTNNPGIVTSISAAACSFDKYTQNSKPVSLKVGSGPSSSGGYIYFTFSKLVKKIDFTLQGYSKYYSDAWHPDTEAYLDIEGQTFVVGDTYTDKALDPVNGSVTLASPKTTISFSNGDVGGKRVFIHSLTVSFTE